MRQYEATIGKRQQDNAPALRQAGDGHNNERIPDERCEFRQRPPHIKVHEVIRGRHVENGA